MAQEVLRPNSTINAVWLANTYANIDEVVLDPAAGDGNFVQAGKNDSDEEESWGFDNTSLTENVNQITLHLYARSNSNAPTMQMRLEVGAGNYTDYQSEAFAVGTYTWYTYTFNADTSWTTAQINDLRVNILAPSDLASTKTCNIDTMYVTAIEGESGGGGGGGTPSDNSKSVKTVLLGSPF